VLGYVAVGVVALGAVLTIFGHGLRAAGVLLLVAGLVATLLALLWEGMAPPPDAP
jgi:hypothetical protein